MHHRSSTPLLVVPAAIIAVLFWSFKPVLITLLSNSIGYSEAYVLSGFFAIAASLIVAVVFRSKIAQVFKLGALKTGLVNSAISGLFLALWYYGFYRALYGAVKTDATIIAFIWPLIAVVATPLLSPNSAQRLRWYQWVLLFVSFGGAVAIALNDGGMSGERSWEILWAFAAALGSGLYLPFALRATKAFSPKGVSPTIGSFVTISSANVVAVSVVAVAVLLTAGFDYSGLTWPAAGFCFIIGGGVYLLAEVAWTWAFQEYKSLTLAALPYFSPSVSVVLLYVLFDEPVTSVALVGLLTILTANLVLYGIDIHKSRRRRADVPSVVQSTAPPLD